MPFHASSPSTSPVHVLAFTFIPFHASPSTSPVDALADTAIYDVTLLNPRFLVNKSIFGLKERGFMSSYSVYQVNLIVGFLS